MHLKTWPWILSPVKTPGFESVAHISVTRRAFACAKCFRPRGPQHQPVGNLTTAPLETNVVAVHMFCGASHARTATLTDVDVPQVKQKNQPCSHGRWPCFQANHWHACFSTHRILAASTRCWERWLVYLQNYSNHGWRMVKIYDIRFIFLYGLWYMFKPDLWCVFFMTVKHLCCMQLRFCWSFE